METSTQAERLVLASLEIVTEAKAAIVQIDGIGTELRPTLIGWEHTHPIGYAMLHDWPPSPLAFTRSISTVAGLMVNGWHATGLTLSLESYAETSDPFTQHQEPISLATRYATDPTIKEALWVAYADRLGGTSMGVITYTQTVGRIVNYDEPVLSHPHQHADFDVDGTLPNVLRYALKTHASKPAPKGATLQACRHAISSRIHQLGYTVFIPDDPNWATQY